jgi:hypothetical protein
MIFYETINDRRSKNLYTNLSLRDTEVQGEKPLPHIVLLYQSTIT